LSASETSITAPIHTERFDLVNCSWKEAYRITENWRRNPEIAPNIMLNSMDMSTFEWAKYARVDGKKSFIHAIVDREAHLTIGAHRLIIDASGTAHLILVVSAPSWHGKGVFEEVRSAILDRFSDYPLIQRFSAAVLARNFPSIYNYQKLGFRNIGYAKRLYLNPVTSKHDDVCLFEMLPEDWRSLRGDHGK